jgi:hypothetical protein
LIINNLLNFDKVFSNSEFGMYRPQIELIRLISTDFLRGNIDKISLISSICGLYIPYSELLKIFSFSKLTPIITKKNYFSSKQKWLNSYFLITLYSAFVTPILPFPSVPSATILILATSSAL